MKKIKLTQGMFALVDNCDYPEMSNYRWYALKNGNTWYAARNVGKCPHRKKVLMHRQILGALPGQQCDHMNHNGCDNRRMNIRLCTSAQNRMNERPRKGGSSKFKGVSFNKECRKWKAQITLNGKRKHLGYFTKEIDAVKARDDAERELFGEFANPNFPQRIAG